MTGTKALPIGQLSESIPSRHDQQRTTNFRECNNQLQGLSSLQFQVLLAKERGSLSSNWLLSSL
eukprot:6462242-Amphidinium_carterae.4